MNETYGVVPSSSPLKVALSVRNLLLHVNSRTFPSQMCHVSVALSSGEASTPLGSWPSRHCLSSGLWKSCSGVFMSLQVWSGHEMVPFPVNIISKVDVGFVVNSSNDPLCSSRARFIGGDSCWQSAL